MRDAVTLGVLVGAFALFVTTHLALCARLLGASPRWRAPVALVVLPLAPYWAHGLGWRIGRSLWIAAAAVYAVALTLALR